MHLRGLLRPSWTQRMLSAAVLTASRTHLGPSGRIFGALLSRLGRAQGVPGGPFESPKLTRTVFLYLSVSLFYFVRRFRHFGVPFWAVFAASWGPLVLFFDSFKALWRRLGPPPSHEIHDPKKVGRRCLPPQGRSIK